MKNTHKSVTDSNSWMHRFAVFTACCTFLLIIAGALVTGNEAGLSVPDWPLSYGSLMPPWVGNIRYEHGHRIIATFVGLLTVVLAIWIWKKETRKPIRLLGWVALGTVIVQGILGGITVLFFLPIPISVMHACLAQAFFCTVLSLAWMTSSAWKRDTTPLVQNEENLLLGRLGLLTTASIYLQLILGAALRHSKSGIAFHIIGAMIVTIVVAWVTSRVYRHHPDLASLTRLSLSLTLLLVVQLCLGIGSYIIRLETRNDVQPALSMVAMTTSHVAVGALLLGTSLILTLQSFRLLAPPRQEIRFSAAPQKATP